MNSLLESSWVEALRLGLIGLAFLLACLAFLLLRKEQQKNEPRKAMLGAVYIFMAFIVGLCILVLVERNWEQPSDLPAITWSYEIAGSAGHTGFVQCSANGKPIGHPENVRTYVNGGDWTSKGVRLLCAGTFYQAALSRELEDAP